MDTLLVGILASSNPEVVKDEVVRRVVAEGSQPEHTTAAAVAVLQTCTRLLLVRPPPPAWDRDACRRVYASWARCKPTALRQFVTPATLERLLECDGAAWVLQTSLTLMREYRAPGGDGYAHLCERVGARAAAVVRERPEFGAVVALCRLLRAVPECLPVDAAPFCAAVVRAVAGFAAPPGTRHLREYVAAVPTAIGQLLEYLWGRPVPVGCEAPLQCSLRELSDVISYRDDADDGAPRHPSVALAALVQFIPVELAGGVARAAAGADDAADVTLALGRVINWLSWPGASNTHLWVLAFLRALAAERKYTVLVEACHKTGEQVFENLRYPAVRDSCFAVFSHMMLSCQHSPDVFHKVVDRVPELVAHVRAEHTQEARRFVEQLAELVHCLMHLHPGFPDLYEPLLETFKDLPVPSAASVRRRLDDAPRWSVGELTAATAAVAHVRSETGHTGLVNLGNTCYANSVLQALYMCHGFRHEVLAASVRPGQKLLSQLQRTFAFLMASTRAAYAPVELLRASRPPWFAAGCQQDCSEYLKYLLDQLAEQERASRPAEQRSRSTRAAARSTADRRADDALADQRPRSTDQDDGADTLAERAFGGRMRNTYACLTCGGESARTEPFTDIPLAFPAADDDTTPAADAPPAADRLSVDALLAHYFATERLVGGNQYACGRCGRLRDATRTPALVRAPRCLVISLLRFSYCAATRRREKVLRDVRCPRRLGLPLLAPGGGGGATVADYALTAVVVHAGTSSDAGHYYTHARGMDAADDWALFNDSRVTPSSYNAFSRLTDRFARDTAYVLVYTRADALPPEGATDRPLGAELRAAVERDNRLHHQEEELAARTRALDREAAAQSDTAAAYYRWDNDNDRGPPGSCGGGGGLHQGSRLVY